MDRVESPLLPASDRRVSTFPQRVAGIWRAMRPLDRAVLVVLALVSLVWLWLGAYQSHYISGLRLLGDDVTQTIFGTAKEGRGDEWSTYIPILKQAYLEGFPGKSALEPYFESYRLFVGIPAREWTLIFSPTLALYFAVPGPLALSFQGLFYNVLFIASFVWLLGNLGVKREVAIPAGVMTLFSMFYQVWWTSNLSTLGPSLLPLAVLSSSLRWRYRFPLLTWSIAHMLLGAMYPPFYYVIAFSLVPLILLLKPVLWRPSSLLFAAASVVIAVAIYWIQYADYIEAVSVTTYPGARFSTGGGAPWNVLLGLVFPTAAATSQADVGLTLYELSVVGTILPFVALAAFFTGEQARASRPLLALFVIMSIFMATFAVVDGFPETFVRYSGLFLVPGRRMQLGLSLLTVAVCAILISKAYDRIENRHLMISAILFTTGSLLIGSRADVDGQFHMFNVYPWLFIGLVLAGSMANVLGAGPQAFGRGTLGLPVVLWGAALAHLVIFGSFNPLMRAKDILAPVQTQLTEDWKALFAANGSVPIATIGNFGHLLRGENLAAMEAIHLVNVQDDAYARTFPELTLADRQKLFNQMRGIRFDNVGEYDASGLTAIIPVMPHTYRIPTEARLVARSELEGIESLNESVVVSGIEQTGVAGFRVHWKSVLGEPIPLDAALIHNSDCRVGSVDLTRYPVDITAYSGRVMLRGLAGVTVFHTGSSEAAALCAASLRLTSPAVVAQPAPRFSAIPSSDLATASWSGHACDLSGEPERRHRSGRAATFEGYLVGATGGLVPEFDLVFRSAAPDRLYAVRAGTGALRRDVAEYFKTPSLLHAGFRARVSLESVERGRYEVVFLFAEDGGRFFCESGKTVEVF